MSGKIITRVRARERERLNRLILDHLHAYAAAQLSPAAWLVDRIVAAKNWLMGKLKRPQTRP